MKTAERRHNLKEALIAAAERSIDANGLVGMKARDLATEVGCSVGAIYNVVADLDELVLAVNGRTLTMMETELAAAAALSGQKRGAEKATALMVDLAQAYLHFAVAHKLRWRALFDHRMPEGSELPGWYLDQQRQIFAFIEQPLRVLQPDLTAEQFALLARSLFSAVHGIVALGLEEKLGAISVSELEKQTTAIVTALGHGLSARRGSTSRSFPRGHGRLR
jgi:AcrR family transcriptional regulator